MNELLDFLHIARYRENNRIEAKRAQGGLPHSLWETYSAFANTLGGVILLGVMEGEDHRFYTVPVNAARLKEELLSLLSSGRGASVNLLREEDVVILPVDGNEIVAVFVPRADRREKPVYIGSDPMTGTYLRDGEGDYRCPREVVLRMLFDRERACSDGTPLPDCSLSDLSREDIADYCRLIGRAGEEETVLFEKKALIDMGGKVSPTAAGLLFFGSGGAIARKFPAVALSFQGNGKIFAPKGENGWSLYRYARAVEGECKRFTRDGDIRAGIKETLTNALVNADYDCGGVTVSFFEEGAETVNAGVFSPSPERAVDGVFEPRNETLSSLFSAMGWGSRAGGGLYRLYETWKARGWKLPTMEETLSPPSVKVTLWLTADDGKPCTLGRAALFRLLLDHVTRRASVTAAELAEELRCPLSLADELLYEGKYRRILVREGERWRLKERA